MGFNDSSGTMWTTYDFEEMLTVSQQIGTFGNWSLSQRAQGGFMRN